MDNYHRADHDDDESTEVEEGSAGEAEESSMEEEDESKRYEWSGGFAHNDSVSTDDNEEETEDDNGPIIDNLEGENSGNEDESISDGKDEENEDEEEEEEDISQDETVQSDHEAGETDASGREDDNVNNCEEEDEDSEQRAGEMSEEKKTPTSSQGQKEQPESCSSQEEAELSASGSRKHKHPCYAKMIRCAIASMDDRGGSSNRTIVTHIMARFDVPQDRKEVSRHIAKALADGLKRKAFKRRRTCINRLPLYKLVEGNSTSGTKKSKKMRPTATRKRSRPRPRSVDPGRKVSRQPLATRSEKLVIQVLQKRRRRIPNKPKPAAVVTNKQDNSQSSVHPVADGNQDQRRSKRSSSSKAINYRIKRFKRSSKSAKEEEKPGEVTVVSVPVPTATAPAVVMATEAVVAPGVKKGPGRPRKYPKVVTGDAAESQVKDKNVKKQPPGRPRKSTKASCDSRYFRESPGVL